MAWIDAPAVVVGAGPVGLVTANLLGDAGVPTVLLERETRPYGLPRAAHLDDEALAVLAALGLDDAIAEHTRPAPGYELRDARDRVIVTFRRGVSRLGLPASSMFHQPGIEAALRARAESHPLVDVRLGWTAEALQPHGPVAVVRARDLTVDRAEDLEADAVLACDGATSTIRRLLGIGLDDRGHHQSWVVVDALLPREVPPSVLPLQRCDPARPTTSVPMGGRRHRWEFQVLPGEDGRALLHPRLLERLIATQADPRDVEVERAAVYRFHAVTARRWRVGRVVLLGDAAHQMPPFLGQGLCSGLRDAANVVWKYALVRDGTMVEGLLDTYEAERRAHVDAITRLTVAVGRFITTRWASAEVLRRAVGVALRAAPPLDRAVGGIGLPGLRNGPLVAGARPGSLAGRPLLRPGRTFTMAGLGVAPEVSMDPLTRRVWEALGAGTTVLGGAGREVALVRPDGVVLGTARAGDTDRIARLAARVARYLA